MSRDKGDAAERSAEEFLRAKGWRILERNFRTRSGEIDLVAQEGDTVVFVEVRSRASSAFGTPAETVTREKQRRIIRTAQAWALRRGGDVPMRFDVVAISAEGTTHIPAAFDATGFPVTLHVPCGHRCACGAFFIPFAPGVACPKCGAAAKETFDFVPQAAASLRFNLKSCGSYLPAAWYVGSFGDHVLRILFVVFEGYRTEAAGSAFEPFLDRKIAGMEWGDQAHLKPHVRDIAVRVQAVL